jgi:hypothetical protein
LNLSEKDDFEALDSESTCESGTVGIKALIRGKTQVSIYATEFFKIC